LLEANDLVSKAVVTDLGWAEVAPLLYESTVLLQSDGAAGPFDSSRAFLFQAKAFAVAL